MGVLDALVAQRIEHRFPKAEVAGSNPAWGITMSVMISGIKGLDSIRFEPFPTKPIVIKKIVRLPHHNTIFATAKNCDHIVYTTHGRLTSNVAFYPNDWPWLGKVIAALVKLEVADKALLDKHLKDCKERAYKAERKYEAESFGKNASKLGIKLTDEQKQIIDSAIAYEDH